MKKRTSKSASATPRTSSPSGTSAQTDATENGRRKVKAEGKFAYVVESLEGISGEEFRKFLVDAGILDPSTGQLMRKYKQGGKA